MVHPTRSHSSALVAGAFMLLMVASCPLTLWAFAGTSLWSAAGRALPRVPLQVNMFEGLPGMGLFGDEDEVNPEESGTSSARVPDANSRVVEVSMPLGIVFREDEYGDVYVKKVFEGSDAFNQGVRPGAQVVMVSATFGEEMWNARGVGLTQLQTVVKSRFGSTMKLALEKEDKNVLDQFMDAIKPETPEEKAEKQARMAAQFEATEKNLEDKSFWNPFR